jgi:hypothetical protein
MLYETEVRKRKIETQARFKSGLKSEMFAPIANHTSQTTPNTIAGDAQSRDPHEYAWCTNQIERV